MTTKRRLTALIGAATLLCGLSAHAQSPAAPDANAPAANPVPGTNPPTAATPPDNGTTPDTGTTPNAAAPAPTPPGMPQATPVPAPASSPRPASSRFRIGPAVGLYLPSSGKTRDRFGDSWFGIGIGLGSINPVRTSGALMLDANLFYHERDGNHAFFLPIGLGYRIALSPGTNVVPYAGVSADLDFSEITSNPDNIHNSFNVGAGGSVFVGANFGDSAFIEARYLELSRANGFDLSGLSLTAGYRF
jgi:hypothetical protein